MLQDCVRDGPLVVQGRMAADGIGRGIRDMNTLESIGGSLAQLQLGDE